VLRYMFPGHAVDHLMHSSRADSKVICDGLLCCTFRKLVSYLAYFLFSKNGFGVVDAALSWVSVLAVAVIHVVGGGAKKQVSRVDTRSVVARMTNVEFSRVFPISEKIRKSVGVYKFFVNAKMPVASSSDSSGPQPAVITSEFSNTFPKSQFSFCHVHAVHSTTNGSFIQ
jgi:hypothetical protein